MKNPINATHIEGLIYESALELRIAGEKAKNPGTPFIMGILKVATDDACTNIVPVHFTYVTAVTSKGTANATFPVLKKIVDGEIGTVMAHGKENAGKVRIDSAIGLNEFYSDRNGEETLVSVKRNEGGFVHIVNALNADEKARNTFTADIVITKVSRMDANEERNTPERVIVHGCVFDFRKAILPVDFVVTNARGMDYFEGLDVSVRNPIFTKVWGRQKSQVITTKKVEESSWGDDCVQESTATRNEWVITGSNIEPYMWDDESSITAAELTEKMSDRETYLATVRQRQAEYRATQSTPTVPAGSGTDNFNF